MRIAIIGAPGQLGSDLARVFAESGSYEVVGLSHADVEVRDARQVSDVVGRLAPRVIVNCAAFHRVDDAEEEVSLAFAVNAEGALNVARAADAARACLIQISTDYVFDGARGGYVEDDEPHPINVYGTSKLAGENLVGQTCEEWIVVRMASIFGRAGASGKGGNFVETIARKVRAGEQAQVVDDIRMSPTYTLDAAHAIERLVDEGARGTFHVTNEGSCSWYEFAGEVAALVGDRDLVRATTSAGYPTPARRPPDSSLETKRLSGSATGALRPWREALRAYINEKNAA